MSLEEFLARTDIKPYLEYVDGEVFEKPVAKKIHAKLEARLASRLDRYIEMHGGSVMTEAHVNFGTAASRAYRVPDVAYWAPDRPEGDAPVPLPPTLAVEIRSPDQTLVSQRDKCRFMRERGADVCWLIIPETRTVVVFEDDGETALSGDAVLTSDHLPGFALALPDLFAVLG